MKNWAISSQASNRGRFNDEQSYACVGSSDPKWEASHRDEDIVWSIWRHIAAGNAAGIEVASYTEQQRAKES